VRPTSKNARPAPLLAVVAFVVFAPSWASPARAQAGGSFSASSADDVRQTAAQGARATMSMATDASSSFGLVEPAGGRKVVTLEELLASLREAPDARMARERVTQSEAQRRRAWALLLPTLSLSGAYTHTCTGGAGGLDCADRTANVIDAKSLQQQSLLFSSLADVFGIAADAATNPDDVARFRSQQEQLAAAADDITERAASAAPVVVQPASQLAGQLTFAVPLLNPRAYPALMNAGQGVDIALLGVQQAEQALAFTVVRGYHAAFTAQRIAAASARQVELAMRQREAVAARVAAATQPALSLKRAELEALRAQQTLAQTRAAADNAIAILGAALGRTEMFDVVEPPAAVAPDVSGGDRALVEAALAQRLEVRVQRAAVAIAERGTLDAWMQFLPSVGVSATARATSFTSGFVRDPVTGVLSLSATLPLYDGGIRYASLDDASARTSEERVRLQQLEERVAAQMHGNLHDVAMRTKAARLAEEALAVAREAQAQAVALFDAGVGTSLDVTDTSVAVFAAETEALRTRSELDVARVSLRWATGETLYTSSSAR
jgi:outer membrane protein TolC